MAIELGKLLQAKLYRAGGQEVTLQEVFRELNLELILTDKGWFILKDLNYSPHTNIIFRLKYILKVKGRILEYINNKEKYYTNKEEARKNKPQEFC